MRPKPRAQRTERPTTRYVYPTLADGVTIQTGEGDWELGGVTEVVPEDTIDVGFQITGVVIESANRPNKTHELILMAGEREIGRRRFSVSSNAPGVVPVEFETRWLPADTPITARGAVQGTGAKVFVISLQYKTRG